MLSTQHMKLQHQPQRFPVLLIKILLVEWKDRAIPFLSGQRGTIRSWRSCDTQQNHTKQGMGERKHLPNQSFGAGG